ncbi:MAG: hypothetical protein FD122_3720, partial [Stygiobacter sp.]
MIDGKKMKARGDVIGNCYAMMKRKNFAEKSRKIFRTSTF